jgi:hypothetical protein
LAVQQRSIKRPKIKNTDRIFWVWLSRIWHDWRFFLIIVKPPTVIGWHKKGSKALNYIKITFFIPKSISTAVASH